MIYAYARISAKDQNLQRQTTAFREFGIEESRIFSEKKSGKYFERTEYGSLFTLGKSAKIVSLFGDGV